jgi:hypothetical protein
MPQAIISTITEASITFGLIAIMNTPWALDGCADYLHSEYGFFPLNVNDVRGLINISTMTLE